MIQTTQHTLHNGVRNAVIQVAGVSDGTGNETRVVKVNLAALGAKAASVRKIVYNIGYGLVKLSWEALTPVDFAALSDGQGQIEYGRFGGLKNCGGATATGNILLTTSGFELASSYMITFELIKKC